MTNLCYQWLGLLLLLGIRPLFLSAQAPTFIPFIDHTPLIDGRLDPELRDLPIYEFPLFTQFDNPPTDTIPVHYRMGYTARHLYLYIEAQTDHLNYRRRGFINGDGFKLLLGLPQPGDQTNEYYDLGFSAWKDPNYWARQIIITLNNEHIFRAFSPATSFETSASSDHSGFEVSLAWEDIPPYHPWFIDSIGYNLYFAKAIGDTITNGYGVVYDPGIFDEALPYRGVAPLAFEIPSYSKTVLLARPQNRNLPINQPLRLDYVAMDARATTRELHIQLFRDSTELMLDTTANIQNTTAVERQELSISLDGYAIGNYHLLIHSGSDTVTSIPISLLPTLDYQALQALIQQNEAGLTHGAIHTLLFRLAQLRKVQLELRPYENGTEFLRAFQQFQSELHAFEEGADPFANRMTPYRRAFRSKYDQTLQPYTINLPDDYDPEKRYPLLVFLHGSGSDEQGLLDSPRSDGRFIEIAPLGRDIYYCYSSDSAQQDILEAIEDAVTHFPIDTNQIIIGGFSMGGYGALRTYYEHPEKYQAVAVFAGHPYLASQWLEGEHPGFTQAKYTAPFAETPVFIYHGKKDGALSVAYAEQLSEALQKAGAQLSVHIVAEKGHEYPDEATNAAYFRWLKAVLPSK